MYFSLEALHAKQGDSLLLRFGDENEPRLIVIDGGPSGVYRQSLKPRLEQLRNEMGGTLPIEILMVSHLDEDHINGVLQFSEALIDQPELRAQYPVATLWANAFEDMVKPVTDTTEAPAIPASMEAIVASVNEARHLRDNARGLKWAVNGGFDEFVMAPNDGGVTIDLDPLTLTVIGPRQAELDELRKEWVKKIEELRKKGKLDVASAEEVDTKAPNLSSIVCVAEVDDKKMLLTGDALGDKVLAGLETADFLPAGGTMDFDLIKVPHHGSSRNTKVEFFRRLRAPHLVISADGKHHNPDLTTFERISEARPDDDFTIHITESELKLGVGDELERFLAKEKADGRTYDVVRCPPDEILRIDLLDQLD